MKDRHGRTTCKSVLHSPCCEVNDEGAVNPGVLPVGALINLAPGVPALLDPKSLALSAASPDGAIEMLFADLPAFVTSPAAAPVRTPIISSSNRLSSSNGSRAGAGARESSSIRARACRVDCKALSRAKFGTTGSSGLEDGSDGVSASLLRFCDFSFSGSAGGSDRQDGCIRGFEGG